MFVVQYLGCSRSWTSCSSDPKGIENERRICVHEIWSGVTILNLLFPISPFFAFGYYRLATLGPTLDLFENAFIQSFLLCQPKLIGKEGSKTTGSFKLSIPASPNIFLPLASVLHQMMSPCANLLFYWRPIGRLLD